MSIVITGGNGFIGKNLIAELQAKGISDIISITRDTTEEQLKIALKKATFVYHLAGVNRPQNVEEFEEVNKNFTLMITKMLENENATCPILITSSIQAERNNAYGTSKREAEYIIQNHSRVTGAACYIYRLPNVFGKWCKPNYNSAVATFCHNISRDLEINVDDPNVVMKLVYIDDVVQEFISALHNQANKVNEFCEVSQVFTKKVGEVVDLIYTFKKSRKEYSIPKMTDLFTKALYSTYLSYLPNDAFSYPLKMNIDHRGSFTEFIRTADRGQVSINISKPGITKGNHWHHTKNEKFLVVSGQGVIRFRKIDTDEVIEYFVNGEKLEVVDIPVGYTHNIENLGETNMVTVMWVNELFDQERPDTIYLEV